MQNIICSHFIIFNRAIIFENHLSLEKIFDKCWTLGLYENMWEFNITASMVTQKYEEDNGKEKGNL